MTLRSLYYIDYKGFPFGADYTVSMKMAMEIESEWPGFILSPSLYHETIHFDLIHGRNKEPDYFLTFQYTGED